MKPDARLPPVPEALRPQEEPDVERMTEGFVQLGAAAMATGALMMNRWLRIAAGFGERTGNRLSAVGRPGASESIDRLGEVTEQIVADYCECVEEASTLGVEAGLKFCNDVAELRNSDR